MVVRVAETSFDLLGKRWTALIVKDLLRGPRRFRELLTSLGRINDKVLSQRLKELEERGIIGRQVYAEVPVRVEYRLTEKGKGLAGVIHAMEQWDWSWSGDERRHASNGGDTHAGVEGPAVGGSERPAVSAPGAVLSTMASQARTLEAGEDEHAAGFAAAGVDEGESRKMEPPAGPAAAPTRVPFWKRFGL